MCSLGIHDDRFKQSYTELIGAQIEGFMEQYGALFANHINTKITAEGFIGTPDFSNLTRGLSQMDLVAATAFYLFLDPVHSGEATTQRDLIERISPLHDPEGSAEDFFRAYVVSMYHRNVLLAGQRTKELISRGEVLEEKGGKAAGSFEELTLYGIAFGEIDQHQSVVTFTTEDYYDLLGGRDRLDDLAYLNSQVVKNTFAHRSQWMLRLH